MIPEPLFRTARLDLYISRPTEGTHPRRALNMKNNIAATILRLLLYILGVAFAVASTISGMQSGKFRAGPGMGVVEHPTSGDWVFYFAMDALVFFACTFFIIKELVLIWSSRTRGVKTEASDD